ncbi:tautomerase family protein [Bavariicoccus seileri]|uniref:tautomerase family protein n=1 Tax=Bavariicoccus seileri TaxID=549685 RepID=UPI003F927DE7
MPLVRVDITTAYTKEEAKLLLDVVHQNVVTWFKVPDRDRYQVLTRHSEDELILEDTNLGFERSSKRISIQVFSRKRDDQAKLDFYKNVVGELSEKLEISGKDVLISVFENGDADWSFADGEGQFVNGVL